MLSSNGKELYCAALFCQKTRQMILIWLPNICLLLSFKLSGDLEQLTSGPQSLPFHSSVQCITKMIVADQRIQKVSYF